MINDFFRDTNSGMISFGLRKDEGIRANVTVESLGKLKAIRGQQGRFPTPFVFPVIRRSNHYHDPTHHT